MVCGTPTGTPKGEGMKQVRSRGQIIPKGDRKYLVRIYLGRDGNGKRKYDSKLVRGTYKQAEQELTKLLREVDTQVYVTATKQTVAEYLRGWIAPRRKISVKTRRGYTDHIENNIIPYIGGLQLSKLSPREIRALYARLGERLAPNTVRGVHRTLHAALESAVDDGLLAKNPARKCTDAIERAPKVEKDAILTPEEVAKLLQATEGTEYGVLWRLLLTAGLRPQEAFALKWGDIDGRTITIQRAIVEVEGGKREVSDFTKTEGSIRKVTVSVATMEALQAHRSRQAAAILKAGPSYERNDFVFSTRTGQFLDISNVRRRWYKDLQMAGVPRRTLYYTRHTHLSHLLAAGKNPKAIAERAGHADPTMLLRVYGHVLPGADAELADAAEELIIAAK